MEKLAKIINRQITFEVYDTSKNWIADFPTENWALVIVAEDENKNYFDEIIRKAIDRNVGYIHCVGKQHDLIHNMADEEIQMLDKISKAFHAKGKKVVVILNIGGVIETASWKDKVDAILLAWQPGQEGGHSVADVISGKVNPSGKLPWTMPKQLKDSPAHATNSFPGGKTVNYAEGILVGYRWFDTKNVTPLYPFGYGLSYSKFEYSDMQLTSNSFAKNGKIEVSVNIKNTGKVTGKEVVQMYIRDLIGSITRPVKELKGFEMIELKPGSQK